MKMNKLFVIIVFLSSCTFQEQESQKPFPAITISDDEEWTTYEGKWLTEGGVIRVELSLKTGSFGYDSYYILKEFFESENSSGTGMLSRGRYSTYGGVANNEFRICLHHVSTYSKRGQLGFKRLNNVDNDEMFFVTRGNDELLPSGNDFNPLTLDRRYTLHQRSKLFTVEGYFTLEQDSIEFFERNTGENWKVTDLGEFNDLHVAYNKFAKEKYEGIYLRALAYTVRDTDVMTSRDALVIKQIKSLGKAPD
jgi:hypothetical protein